MCVTGVEFTRADKWPDSVGEREMLENFPLIDKNNWKRENIN